MQTLGVAESTPRSENRLKSLFWPAIQDGSDVDYLGAQGYWVCTAVAVLSAVISFAGGHPITAAFALLFYYCGGVGVREHSRYASAAVLLMYLLDGIAAGVSIPRVLVTALLLSNLRATWIAARWTPDSEEATLPPRFAETWSDRFVDRWPAWLWPRMKVLYYIFSAGSFVLVATGLTIITLRHLQ